MFSSVWSSKIEKQVSTKAIENLSVLFMNICFY